MGDRARARVGTAAPPPPSAEMISAPALPAAAMRVRDVHPAGPRALGRTEKCKGSHSLHLAEVYRVHLGGHPGSQGRHRISARGRRSQERATRRGARRPTRSASWARAASKLPGSPAGTGSGMDQCTAVASPSSSWARSHTVITRSPSLPDLADVAGPQPGQRQAVAPGGGDGAGIDRRCRDAFPRIPPGRCWPGATARRPGASARSWRCTRTAPAAPRGLTGGPASPGRRGSAAGRCGGGRLRTGGG